LVAVIAMSLLINEDLKTDDIPRISSFAIKTSADLVNDGAMNPVVRPRCARSLDWNSESTISIESSMKFSSAWIA